MIQLKHSVIEMPEHHPGQMGGTMRLGKRTTIFKTEDSVLRKLYGDVTTVEERHRHRYEVNTEDSKVVEKLEENGMMFVGHCTEKKRMEIMELKDHPYYVAVQYHPEYLSRPLKPSPPYLGLILASCGRLSSYLSHGCRLSPYRPDDLSGSSSSDEETTEELSNISFLRPCSSSSSMGSVQSCGFRKVSGTAGVLHGKSHVTSHNVLTNGDVDIKINGACEEDIIVVKEEN